MKRAILALADGTTFEGVLVRRDRRVDRRGGVQHLDDRVPGDPHRPVVRRADGLHDVPGAGQLRRRPRADEESARPHATGFIVRHHAEQPSNFRAEQSLDAYLAQHGIVGIWGIDTRRLTKHIRTAGAQMGVISTRGERAGARRAGAGAARAWRGRTSRRGISTKTPLRVAPEGRRRAGPTPSGPTRRRPASTSSRTTGGSSGAMLRLLAEAGCRVTVVPVADDRRRDARAQARRRLPHERPGRSRRGGRARARPSPRSSARCRCSASASGTRSSRSPSARGPTSSSSATAARTSR